MWISLDFKVLRPQELRRKLELGIEELTRASIEDGGAKVELGEELSQRSGKDLERMNFKVQVAHF